MEIQRITHVGLCVSDLERSLRSAMWRRVGIVPHEYGGVIPVAVDPAAHQLLDHTEVDDARDRAAQLSGSSGRRPPRMRMPASMWWPRPT